MKWALTFLSSFELILYHEEMENYSHCCINLLHVPRRGDMPFVRRPVARPGIESDEDAEVKSEISEPKPEWANSGLLLQKCLWRNQPN